MPNDSGPFYPEGGYRVSIVDQSLENSKNKGTLTVVLQVKILSDLNGEEVDNRYERKLYLYATAGTAPYLAKNLEKVGYTRDRLVYIDKTQVNYHDLTGQEFDAECKHEEYQGKTREKWSFLFEGSGPLQSTADPKSVRNMDNIYAKAVKANGGSDSPQPAATGPRSDEITDEDLPFN